MTHKIWTIIIIMMLIIGCKAKKTITDSGEISANGNENIETVGHLKMTLIDFEIIDTSIGTQEDAEFMMRMMKPSMESELVFNQFKSADLVKTDEESEYTRRSLYDRQNKKAFQFLSKDSVDYYTEMDMVELVSRVKDSPEELEEINKMFKIKKYEESGVEILGFKCDEVTIMQPVDSSKVWAIVYSTNKIPHVAEAVAPWGNFITGAPLKTVMFIAGLKVTSSAISYEENPSMRKYLEFDPKKYKKLSIEEFEEMNSYSGTKEMKVQPKLLYPDYNPDTTNTVKLLVGADNKILLDDEKISKDQLCSKLTKHLIEKKGIYFTSESSTNYDFYLEVFDSLDNCISALRSKKSMEIYGIPFTLLSDEEKIYIEELIPLRIIETKPQ